MSFIIARLSFNGAATFQLRIVELWKIDNYDDLAFNGAATFQLRIVGLMVENEPERLVPSMEPQLFSCGL